MPVIYISPRALKEIIEIEASDGITRSQAVASTGAPEPFVLLHK